MRRRVWTSAVARALLNKGRKQPLTDSLVAILFHELGVRLSPPDVVKELAVKIGGSDLPSGLCHIDLSRLCEQLRMSVKYQPLTADAILVDEGDNYAAIINSNQTPSSQKKSLAHEIGHIVIFEATGLSEAFGHTSLADRKEQESVEVEELCDNFAAELVMPSQMWRSFLRTNGISAATLNRLKDFYNVSYATIAKRVVDVSLFDCAVVIWQVSPNRRDGLELVRFWQNSHSTLSAYPPQISREQLSISKGSPFSVLDNGEPSVGQIEIKFGGINGRYIAQSQQIDVKYISTILIPERFGWGIVEGNGA